MAQIGNICVLIGDEEWFIGDSESAIPVAILTPDIQTTIINGTARFDGSNSYSDDEIDPLRFVWEVTRAPIHSSVKVGSDESLVLTDDGMTAFLSVDVVGIYEVSLVVIGAAGGCSEPATADTTATRSGAPLAEQTSLDVSWIWELLPDVWTALNNDKSRIETLWRGFAQTTSADILNLYNVSADKSVATIQSEIYRRWLSIRPRLDLFPKTYIVLHEYVEYTANVVDDGNDFSNLIQFQNTLLPDLIQAYHGTGIVSGPHEIIVDPRPITSDIGDTLIIIVDNHEFIYSIGGVSFSNSSFLIPGQVIDVPFFPFEVGFKVIPKKDIYLSALVDGKSVTPYEYIDALAAPNPRTFLLKTAESKLLAKDNVPVVLSSSLISEMNFEELGVRPGDLLIGEIGNRQFTTTTTVRATILSVEGTRLSFKFDDENKWVNDETAQRYANQLGVDTVATEFDGSISITGNADILQEIFGSKRFRNRYFNRPLTSDDTIILGDFAFKIRPLFIIRNTLVPIADDIVTFLNLVEYIEKPTLSDDRLTLLGLDGVELELSREPCVLAENTGYLIVDSNFMGNNLSGSANSSTITAERGFFLDRNVEPKDTIEILNGFSRGSYTVLEVQQDTLVVTPVIPNDFIDARYKIVKLKDIKYVKFLGQFTADSPAPETLWSETAILSNDKTIESNFGSILRLPIEEWERRELPASYKATVLGLLRARMLGATVDAIEKTTNILSGLPFVDRRGVIREIDYDYLVDSHTGSALVTKILIEDLDSVGLETGVLHAHYIKALNDDLDADFIGIALNPRTGLRFAVGDQINENEVLSLGVKVSDRQFGAAFPIHGIQSFHNFRVLVSADNTSIDSKGVYYLHDFLLEIKPHYVHIILAFYKYLLDRIEIEDVISFKLRTRLFDNAYFLNFGAEINDEFLQGFGRNDEAMAMIRTPWVTHDLMFIGEDVLESLTGGFQSLLPRIYADGQVIKTTDEPQGPDYLWIQNGHWQGRYAITSILSDTRITVDGSGFTAGNGPFRFKIVRPDREILTNDFGAITLDTPQFLKVSNAALWADDVSPGDLVSFKNASGTLVHTVVGIDKTDSDRFDRLQLIPDLNLAEDPTNLQVRRRGALNKIRVSGATLVVDAFYKCTLSIGAEDFVNIQARLIEPGNVLVYDGVEYPIVGTTNTQYFYLWPTLITGTYEDVQILKLDALEVLDGLDQNLAQIDDPMIFKIQSGAVPLMLQTSEDDRRLILSANAVNIYKIRPGDIIRILAGNGALIDVGEGPGIFRVISAPSMFGNGIDINAYMPADESDIEYEIWKLRPNRQIYWKDPT